MNNLNDLVKNIAKTRILLIGDIMLDKFVYGSVSKISPEGPIPVLKVNKENDMLGGAGNVLANLCALGAQTHIVAVTGVDDAGVTLQEKVKEIQGSSQYLYQDNDRPTSLKTRYLAQNQQLLRVDNEQSFPVNDNVSKVLLQEITSIIADYQILILSDYGKGVLTPELLKNIIKLANKHDIPVIVDPKGTDFSIYKGATVVTPNKKELSGATKDMPTKTDEEVELAGRALIKQSGIKHVIATRSEDGISVIRSGSKNTDPVHLPTEALEVFDVSGAGDTVIATIAAAMAAGGDLVEAAQLANVAGGIAVSKIGTAVVRAEEVLNALETAQEAREERSSIAPVFECPDKAAEQIRKWQAQGYKVGFTNGCFDIIHYGHVHYLNEAKARCDRLILALNHDASVKLLKGDDRPVNDQMARAAVVGALASVDMVVFFGAKQKGADNTPCEILEILKPDIFMKGGDYTLDQLPEAKIIQSYNGVVEIMPLYDGYSTTNIIKKMAS